jgi:hypothetical protein
MQPRRSNRSMESSQSGSHFLAGRAVGLHGHNRPTLAGSSAFRLSRFTGQIEHD